MKKKKLRLKNKKLRQQLLNLKQSLALSQSRLQHSASGLRAAYEIQLSSLSPNKNYDVTERLKSGTIVTHLRCVDLERLKSYVRAVFIDAAPPQFLFRVSEFDEDEEYPNFVSDPADTRENFDDWSEADEEQASGGPWWVSAFRVKGALNED